MRFTGLITVMLGVASISMCFPSKAQARSPEQAPEETCGPSHTACESDWFEDVVVTSNPVAGILFIALDMRQDVWAKNRVPDVGSPVVQFVKNIDRAHGSVGVALGDMQELSKANFDLAKEGMTPWAALRQTSRESASQSPYGEYTEVVCQPKRRLERSEWLQSICAHVPYGESSNRTVEFGLVLGRGVSAYIEQGSDEVIPKIMLVMMKDTRDLPSYRTVDVRLVNVPESAWSAMADDQGEMSQSQGDSPVFGGIGILIILMFLGTPILLIVGFIWLVVRFVRRRRRAARED